MVFIEVNDSGSVCVLAVLMPVMPLFNNVKYPDAVVVAPTVLNVITIVATKSIAVPVTADTAVVTDANSPSEVVPAVPYLAANVLVLAREAVHVPCQTIVITVPATILFAAIEGVFWITVSAVFIPPDALVIFMSPILSCNPTNAVDAICVVFVPTDAVGVVGVPRRDGEV